jgi:hypothetical protein
VPQELTVAILFLMPHLVAQPQVELLPLVVVVVLILLVKMVVVAAVLLIKAMKAPATAQTVKATWVVLVSALTEAVAEAVQVA